MNTKSLLDKLSKIIAESGKSHSELAKIAGLPVTKINELSIKRPKSVKVDDIIRLCDGLNIPVDHLFCEDTITMAREPGVKYGKPYEIVEYLQLDNNYLKEIVKEQVQIIKTLSNEKNNVSNGATA